MTERLSTTTVAETAIQPVPVPGAGIEAGVPTLLAILRRRWTVLGTLLATVLVAGLYLAVATPIYTGSSSLYIAENGPKILSSDTQGFIAKSDSFLFTQAEVIQSEPILTRALEKVDYRRMKTFKDVKNVIHWMQLQKDFKVEVGKKDDVVTVSLDSPYPQEAADVVNAIVDSYMMSVSTQKKTTAEEIFKILAKEKENRDAELTEATKALLSFKQLHGTLSFADDKGNIILQRLVALSQSLTSAEIETIKAKSSYKGAREILANPDRVRDYVENLQGKGSSSGDDELKGLRDLTQKALLARTTLGEIDGPNASANRVLVAQMQMLNEEIAKKEQRIAQSHLSDALEDLTEAEDQEEETRTQFNAQKAEALTLNAQMAELSKLQDDVTRIQKQCDTLDERMKEVNVNQNDGALNVQILEVAHAEDEPTKPRKTLTMSVALALGLLLGTGLALLREWLEHRFRSPDEVTNALGVATLGVVSLMRERMTVQVRGQQVHRDPMSEVAEAYRTLRTSVQFGAPADLKTLLVTSPRPGDGKSVVASNLAIAMAQAGLRTLLLDADFRKPTQHKIFELDDKVGTASVIAGEGTLRDAIRRTNVPHLCVLPCGPLPNNPSELIAGPHFAQIMEAVCNSFDRIVIDSPPVMAVTDARILAACTDATLFVVRINKTPRKAAVLAIEGLQRVGANVVGTVVNGLPRRSAGSGYGYYGYGYYSGGYHGANARRKAAVARADATNTGSPFVAEEAMRLSAEVLTLGNGSHGNGSHRDGNGIASTGSSLAGTVRGAPIE